MTPATPADAGRVRSKTTLRQAEGKNATGIVIPDALIDRLGHGRRPPVRVTINGYKYRTTVGVMGGVAMVGVSAMIREDAGLAAGDPVDVELVVDESPREVDVPPDFAGALDGHPGLREFFDSLSNSLQRYHVDSINGAKAEETRRRRIEKAVSLFLVGKER